jgi:hypothetical protein
LIKRSSNLKTKKANALVEKVRFLTNAFFSASLNVLVSIRIMLYLEDCAGNMWNITLSGQLRAISTDT